MQPGGGLRLRETIFKTPGYSTAGNDSGEKRCVHEKHIFIFLQIFSFFWVEILCHFLCVMCAYTLSVGENGEKGGRGGRGSETSFPGSPPFFSLSASPPVSQKGVLHFINFAFFFVVCSFFLNTANTNTM